LADATDTSLRHAVSFGGLVTWGPIGTIHGNVPNQSAEI
jgi:uncharacterized membrane protein